MNTINKHKKRQNVPFFHQKPLLESDDHSVKIDDFQKFQLFLTFLHAYTPIDVIFEHK